MVAGSLVASGLVVGAAGLTGVATADGLAAPDLGTLSAFIARDDAGKNDAGKNEDRKGGEHKVDEAIGKGEESTGKGDERPGADPESWKSGKGDGAPTEATSVACSSQDLIQALVHANAEGGGNLKLAPKCTYTLTGSEESGNDRKVSPEDKKSDRSGLPVIYQPINIEGEGSTIVRDRSAEEFRLFTVRTGGQLVLKNLILENGRAAIGGSVHIEDGAAAALDRVTIRHSLAWSAELGGGAVFNEGHLTVAESKFVENRTVGKNGKGGGILNSGVFRAEKSEFIKNHSSQYGGGLSSSGGSADISKSTFANNMGGWIGGGIAIFMGRSTVSDTKLVDNRATVGAGIANGEGVSTLRNVTIRNNTAWLRGGGLSNYLGGLVTLDDSIVAENRTYGDGGGIYGDKAKTIVRHTEVSRNKARSQAGGIFVDGGELHLLVSTVEENQSGRKPGGIFAKNNAKVKVDDDTSISGNKPTNCKDSEVGIPNCFA